MDRETCHACFRMKTLCLCGAIQTFEIEPLVVLLVHPREFMKTIGTVRVVKLSLTGSVMLRGHGKDFDQDPTLTSILANPSHHPLILFPGSDSLNLTNASAEMIDSQLPSGKRLVILVIDGTWSTAKNMIRDSKVLSSLPKLSFDVDTSSIYGFRKQPNAYSLSTLEAVSVLIENLKTRSLCTPKPIDGHLKMLEGFKKIIASQLDFESRPQHREGKKFRRGQARKLPILQ